MSKQPNWTPSPTEYATIIDADTGKSPQLSEEDIDRNLALASPYMLATLQRAEFLLRRISEGDHRALENAPSGAAQCRDAIHKASRRTA